jgi:hypothetical protein
MTADPFVPDGDWPPIGGMTPEATLVDLRRHTVRRT